VSPEELIKLEREDILAGLDVLVGLMACLAAMDERQDDYVAWVADTVNRPLERVEPHWLRRRRRRRPAA
jgi:hypothetical protein